MLRGNGGSGYIRVDWFTPDGLSTWGDGRLTILGTDGFIEIRKNVDIGGRPGGSHLFLVDQKETRYVDCSERGAALRRAARGRRAQPHGDGDAAGALLPGHGARAARGEAGAAGGFDDDLEKDGPGGPGPQLVAAAFLRRRTGASGAPVSSTSSMSVTNTLRPCSSKSIGGALGVAAHGHPGAELLVAEPLPYGQGLVHGLLLFCGAA